MGNDINIIEDDIFLVSYPKSGNTWMRFLIGTLFYKQKLNWETLHQFVPNLYETPEFHKQETVHSINIINTPSPRMIKSHEPFNQQYPKVIYIVRDVRSVVISFYYYYLKMFQLPDSQFEAFFESFMEGKVLFGAWDEHVTSWIHHQNQIKNGFLLLKYEDLMNDTSKEANKISQFLSLNRTDEEIKQAVQWSSFQNMKKLEKAELPHSSIPFVRSGKDSEWKDFLTEEQQEQMVNKYGETLRLMGYL
jgi:hypothetical protein